MPCPRSNQPAEDEPDGHELRTMRQAADYIAALLDREAEAAHWQLAIENLINAADHGGIVMLARIAMLRATQPWPEGRVPDAAERTGLEAKVAGAARSRLRTAPH